MTEVTFYEPEEIENGLLKFAVIAARFENYWVFCRHKARNTWEIPGGHRESGEGIDEAAAESYGKRLARERRISVRYMS